MAVPLRLSSERAARVERWLDAPMLAVTLLMIPVFALEGAHVGRTWKRVAAGLNWFVWAAFLAEALVLLAVVPDRGRWLREHPVEAAVVVLTPPFLPAGLQALRLLRLLRLIRLLALWKYLRRVFTLEGLRYAALTTVLILLGGGVAFSEVEKGHSSWDGMWWAATTMTTVGYGDLEPRTTAGRLIGLVVMFTGIGFGTLVIAGLANAFVARTLGAEVREVEAVEREVQLREEDVLAELRALRLRLEEIERALTRRSSRSGEA